MQLLASIIGRKMNSEIRSEILIFLSNKIRDIEYKRSLSGIQKDQRLLDLCIAFDEIEGREKPLEKPEPTFDFLRVTNPTKEE